MSALESRSPEPPAFDLYREKTRNPMSPEAGLETRLISICEHYVTLESEPRYRIVDTLMREFQSLSTTAGALGHVGLWLTAAVAGEVCLAMMHRGQYNRRSDLAMLERLIRKLDGQLAADEPWNRRPLDTP